MNSFQNMKIGSKILMGNAVLIGILLLVAAVGFYEVREAVLKFEDVYENRVVPLRQLNRVSYALMQTRTNMFGEVIDVKEGRKDDIARRLEESRALRKDLNDQWAAYKATLLVAAEQEQIKIYDAADPVASAKREAFVEALMRGDDAEATRFLEEHRVEFVKMRDAVQKLIDIQVTESKVLYDAQTAAYRRTILIYSLLVIVSLVVAGVILWVMRRYITTPLQHAVARMKDLAEGEGDLTKRLEAKSTDEIGDMAHWINRFIENVQQIVKEISGNTGEVRDSSRRLAGASQNLSAGIEEMSVQSRNISASATQMNQNFQVISSSVEEMSTSVGEVARNASDASRIAREANETANVANTNIKHLGDDAREIGKVVETIQGIAAQTNLLALNAAIEAAGAGEAGKGFAVVASEVKELARQAGEATEEIKKRIEAIQGSSETAVHSIGEIATVIARVNEFATTIASAVEEQSITAREIAGNVNQATQASSDVVQNISGISQATQDGAKNAQGLSGLAGQMDTLSGRLEQIVQRFKI